MKDITRIHIAKVAYDIEITAKEELEKYMQVLNSYAEDSELIDDIEIRLTELLAERKVPAGGVITSQDIKSIRQQLGEPSDFAPEDAETKVAKDEGELVQRKLYRDQNAAILGGVLAGMSQFLRIETIWLRLIFIVLLIGSFGAFSIAYLILWLVIPPARSAAERLQLRGESVTLDSIKRLGDEVEPTNDLARRVRQAVRMVVGIGLLLVAFGALVATAVIGAALLLGIGSSEVSPFSEAILNSSWEAIAAYVLFIISGLLLSALGLLLAHAVFTKKFVKRTAVAVAAIVVAGIITSSTAAGILIAASTYNYQQAQAALVETEADLPLEFNQVKKLSVSADPVVSNYISSDVKIEYVVSSGRANYELSALPGLKPEVTVEGDRASIALNMNLTSQRDHRWVQPRLVIYGPALEEVEVKKGLFEYSVDSDDEQPSLTLISRQASSILLSGSYKQLIANGDGTVDVSDSKVVDLIAKMDGGSLMAGVVRTLQVTQRDVCSVSGAQGNDNQVTVSGVSSNELIYNNQKKSAKTIKSDCGSVVIGDNRQDWN